MRVRAVIVSVIISTLLGIYSYYQTINNKIEYTGTYNSAYISVSINSEQDYRKMLELADQNKLSIIKFDYQSSRENNSVYFNKNYVNDFTKNFLNKEFTNNYFLNRRLTFIPLSKLKKEETYGQYRVTDYGPDPNNVHSLFEKNKISSSIILIEVKEVLQNIEYILLALILIILNVLISVENKYKYKEIFVLKLFSKKRELYKFLYKDLSIIYLLLTLTSCLSYFFVFKIKTYSIYFDFLILPLLCFLFLHFILSDLYRKKIIVTDVKGIINMKQIYYVYQIFIALFIFSASFLIFVITGKNSDELNPQVNVASWPIQQKYATLKPSFNSVKQQMDVSTTKYYSILNGNNAIFIDSSFLDTFLSLNNTKTPSLKKEMNNLDETYKSIDVNYNYIKTFYPQLIGKTDKTQILISKKQYHKIKHKNKLCVVNDLRLAHCTIKFVKDDTVFFANINNINNKKGEFNNIFVRVLADNVIKKNNLADFSDVYIPITNKDNLHKDFLRITKLIGDQKEVSAHGHFDSLTNGYNELKDVYRINNDFILKASILTIILIIITLSFIIEAIKLNIHINLKEIFIKKTLGYSIVQRYCHLIMFISISLIGSNILILVFGNLLLHAGYVNYLYYVTIILTILLLIAIVVLAIHKQDKVAINNILKGEK